MNLSDNKTNTEILYLYFEKFKWTSYVDTEQFHGHPKAKSVYRAILNRDTGGYRIIYKVFKGNPMAVFINSLDNENEEEGFVCKACVLEKFNILKYDLSEEEIDKLLEWVTINNKDLTDIINNSDTPTKVGDPTNEQPLDQNIVEDVLETTEFISCALELKKFNPLLFDSLHEFIHHINDQQPPDTSVDSTWISLSKKFGTGANINEALKHIAVYAGENKRTNLDEYDLFEAVKCLLNEFTQRNFNR